MKSIKTLYCLIILFFCYQNASSQCFEIESILVDACGGTEGFNEMVRFKTGATPLDTNTLVVSWPNNSWQGVIQNATTAAVTAIFNADIVAAGGCGQLIEAPGGIIPAGETAILVTSYVVDPVANSFGALTQNIYIVYQNNGTTSTGHFANTGAGIRTLTMISGACIDTVSYDRSLLTGGNGATVVFTPAGIPSYINSGCIAPVPPFTVDAGPPTLNACGGSTISLTGIAQGEQTVLWSATTGSFTTPANLVTDYTIDPADAGSTITLTLTITNACGTQISDTISVTVTTGTVPNFATTLTICSGGVVPLLNTTSPNGITGTWNPSVINNTTGGNYVFTPTTGQCASNVTLIVTVTNNTVPNFATTLTICSGAVAPLLNTTSPNGITGTWNPSVINNTTGGNYVFTPTTGQCASNVTLIVTVTNNTVPNFATTLTICSGAVVPLLNTTSPNGITGTWNPSVINNTTGGNYVFTPTTGQCASNITLIVTVTNNTIPNFATTLTICSGAVVPLLNTTSPNGITGVWNPSVINNTTGGNYVFTPTTGQCASNVTLIVTVTNNTVPNFATTLTICSGAVVPLLNTTSPNGITGTWNPSVINNTTGGNYVFTPTTGQCASNVTLIVTVTNNTVPNFATTLTICSGAVVPLLNTTSPNGITGTWNPSVINNTTGGSYVFTPTTGQCASNATLIVTVTNNTIPNFATTLTICSGAVAPLLNTTSPNGITGTWNPSVINNTTGGNYVFTPTTGQCASNVTLIVTVTNNTVPNFATTLTICSGAVVPLLNTTSPNGITGVWNPSVINNTTGGNYVFTPTTGQCASNVTLIVTVTNNTIPNFATTLTICSGAVVPLLNTTSPNGITGTWNPSVINNTTGGNYVFTPTTGQCASNVTLIVTVTNNTIPNFATTLTICSGAVAPLLNTISPNGITGTWNPSVINNTTGGNYVFTPTTGQCASNVTLIVTVTNNTIPNFATTLTICSGAVVPLLNTTSPNGITGTWNPSVINNTTGGNYVFTPTTGQCASNVTLIVTVTNNTIPNFATTLTICSGAVVPLLNTTSPNGITGTWIPSAISNTTTGTYIFTPTTGQCASNTILTVTVINNVVPDFLTVFSLCDGDVAPALSTTSANGITGSWTPAVINNSDSGNYIFTPDPGQCASSITLIVTVNANTIPNFPTLITICSGAAVPSLNPVSPNGVSGSWNLPVIDNTSSGNYIFTPSAGQCATDHTLNVIVNNLVVPVTDFSYNTPVCASSTLVNPTPLTGFTTGGAYSSDSGLIINAVTGEINIAASTVGPHTITYSVLADPASCRAAGSSAFIITIDPGTNVLPISGPDAVCMGNTIQLANPNPTGTWSTGNNSIATIDNSGLLTAISTGTVTVNYVVNSGLCPVSVTKTITVNPLPTPFLQDGFLCVTNIGEILQLNLDSGVPNTDHSFSWTLNASPLPTTVNNHNAIAPGIYTVTVTNLITGCTATASAVIESTSIAIANATISEDFSNNPSITVNVSGGSGQFDFHIDQGIAQDSNVFLNVTAGEHEITVKDKNGCGELLLTVFVLNYPHYFTPNGDGYHDVWNISGLSDQPDAVIHIFDRYGKLLKTLKPSETTGWDGTYVEKTLPATDYWFKLSYQDKNGIRKQFLSHFSLKR